MKIVRIIARLNVGGPARHVVWLTKALQNDEFESVLMTGTVPPGEEDMSYFAAAHQVEPVFIPEMSRELSAKDVISLWKVYRFLRREKPDIVHTHTAKAGTIGRVAGFFYRWLTPKTLIGQPRAVRFVHTYHGHVFHSYYGKRKTKFFLFIEKALARSVTDKIITISRQQFEEIHNQFGVGKTKQFAVVPLGIDLSPFAEWQAKRNVLRAEIGARDDEILIGLVGRLTEIKNHSLFLQIARLFKENFDFPPLKFVIIGDGHLREKLEKEAEKYNIKDIVTFLGNRNDADVFYPALDIVALTSLNEGTPLSLIEAMANARPCISTAVGGVIDLFGAEKARSETGTGGGFTVCERGVRTASGDAQGFLNGLIYLAKDEKLREELGARGMDFVFGSYDKERLISDIKKVYYDLMPKKG
ncbi:MAG TPA: glycosyltransferase [Pyrinomonadaceae bacterium]|jgi:glycosyltransferase involved in cell wall biosynthesis